MPKSDELRYGAPEENAVHLCATCRGCSRKARNGRCRGCPRPSEYRRHHIGLSREDHLHALYPGEARPGRRHVAALLRALGVDDRRAARPGNDRPRPRPRPLRPAGPDFRQACLFAVDRDGPAPAAARSGSGNHYHHGGETDVCVLATTLGAVDWGFRTILVTDALCSSADKTHDAMMNVYLNRFGQQVECVTTETILDNWPGHTRAGLLS